MDTSKLTARSRDAVSAAMRNALANGNPSAEPVHLLHALLMVPDNTVGSLLSAVGADPKVVDAAAKGAITKLPSAQGSSVTQRSSVPRASAGSSSWAAAPRMMVRSTRRSSCGSTPFG